jgi:hypothetical protein
VVEVNGSPVKISRELKLPSISELLENCTISTPDASFYKSETTTNAETPTTTLVRATSQRTLAFQQLIGGEEIFIDFINIQSRLYGKFCSS